MPSSVSSVSAAPTAGRTARRQPSAALLCLVAAGLLWGTGGLTGTLLGAAAGLSPLAVAALRLLAGGSLITIFRVLPRRRWPAGRAAWTRILVTGALAAIFQAAYFSAVALSTLTLATLVTIGGAPVIVQAVELGLGRRRLDWSGVVTTVAALAGLGLLVGVPAGGYSREAMLASAGMAIVSAGGFAALTLISSSPVPGLDDETVTGYGFVAGGLVLLPLAALAGGFAFRPSGTAFGLLAALGAGPTAIAYTLYFRGLRTTSASTGALLSLLEPLTATAGGVAILGNRLSPAGIAGAAILAVVVVRTVLADRNGHRTGVGMN